MIECCALGVTVDDSVGTYIQWLLPSQWPREDRHMPSRPATGWFGHRWCSELHYRKSIQGSHHFAGIYILNWGHVFSVHFSSLITSSRLTYSKQVTPPWCLVACCTNRGAGRDMFLFVNWIRSRLTLMWLVVQNPWSGSLGLSTDAGLMSPFYERFCWTLGDAASTYISLWQTSQIFMDSRGLSLKHWTLVYLHLGESNT